MRLKINILLLSFCQVQTWVQFPKLTGRIDASFFGHFRFSPTPNGDEMFSPAQRPAPIDSGGESHGRWFQWRQDLLWTAGTLPMPLQDVPIRLNLAPTATCAWPIRSSPYWAMSPKNFDWLRYSYARPMWTSSRNQKWSGFDHPTTGLPRNAF